jgi:hypothetical protein
MRLLTMAVHLLSTVGTVRGSNVEHLLSAEDPEAVICHALPGSVRTRQELSGIIRTQQEVSRSFREQLEGAGNCKNLLESDN